MQKTLSYIRANTVYIYLYQFYITVDVSFPLCPLHQPFLTVWSKILYSHLKSHSHLREHNQADRPTTGSERSDPDPSEGPGQHNESTSVVPGDALCTAGQTRRDGEGESGADIKKAAAVPGVSSPSRSVPQFPSKPKPLKYTARQVKFWTVFQLPSSKTAYEIPVLCGPQLKCLKVVGGIKIGAQEWRGSWPGLPTTEPAQQSHHEIFYQTLIESASFF